MVIYPDSSFLISLYVKEERSRMAQRYMLAHQEPLCFSPFHRLEVTSGLRLRVFRGEDSKEIIRSALRQLDHDVHEQILLHTPLPWSDVLREAESLGELHLAETGARSGDLLHVAAAKVLGARTFLTFDLRQTALARRAGLKIKSWRLN